MTISQKCQYALRATFELAKHFGKGPVKIASIAKAQDIPTKFLETILSDLKNGGFLISKRGACGGYILRIPPDELTAWDIIKFIDGPLTPVKCITDNSPDKCRQYGHCAFLGMWQESQNALADVYKSYTLAKLVKNEIDITKSNHGSYCI